MTLPCMVLNSFYPLGQGLVVRSVPRWRGLSVSQMFGTPRILDLSGIPVISVDDLVTSNDVIRSLDRSVEVILVG